MAQACIRAAIMIVKSMARKRPSFRQLIAYMGRGGGETFGRNLYDAADNPQRVARAFERNHAHLPARRGGNALYHEVIVLPSQPGLSPTRQTAILRDLAEHYCELRAPDCLAYGRVHLDTDHSHIHLMISANPARSMRRVRLSKARFAEIQIDLERNARSRYPSLVDRAIYDRSQSSISKTHRTAHEAAQHQHRGQPSRKDIVRGELETALAAARSGPDLTHRLASAGLELYQRGGRVGLRNLKTNARYRLSTLGMEDALREAQNQWRRPVERTATPIRQPAQREAAQIKTQIPSRLAPSAAQKAFATRSSTPKPSLSTLLQKSMSKAIERKPPQQSAPVPTSRARNEPKDATERASTRQPKPDKPERPETRTPTKPGSNLEPGPTTDPRAAELLRQREVFADRASRILRDFDPER